MHTQYLAFSSSGGSRSSGGSSGFSSSGGSRSGSSYSGSSSGFSSSGGSTRTGTSGFSTSGSAGSSAKTSGFTWSSGTSTGTTPKTVAPRAETAQPTTNNYYSGNSGYNGGSDMFWNYMWWNAAFNRPTYVVGSTAPAGYYVNGGQVYPTGWTVLGSIVSLLLTLTIIGVVLWLVVKTFFRR